MSPRCYVIKLGGSVTTEKRERYVLRCDVISKIASVLKAKLAYIDLPVILIFGGGSFGNVAPTDYRIFEQQVGLPSANLPMMTSVMFSMLLDITRIFVEHSLRVYPFQSGALLGVDERGQIMINTRSLTAAMAAGYIPLLTGDLLLQGERRAEIYSSDNIAALLTVDFEVRRVLYYSDVSGVYDGAGNLISMVDDSNASEVEGFVSGSSLTDLTGGMRNKFMQQRLLASRGVVSEVLSFDFFEEVDMSLCGLCQFGTLFSSG